jgi:hypothetical protein
LAGEWIDPQVEQVSGQEPYQEDCYIIEVTIDEVSRALDPQDQVILQQDVKAELLQERLLLLRVFFVGCAKAFPINLLVPFMGMRKSVPSTSMWQETFPVLSFC